MLKDLVKANRSYRGYDHSVKIPYETLEAWVDLTRYAASSINKQPLRYKIVCEESEVDALQKKTFWARGLPEMTLPHPGKEPVAFVVICHDTALFADPVRFHKDVGIVAQTMLLAAVEEGFGGIMIGNFNPGQVSELLGLPEGVEPQLIVAFGKPDEEVVLVDLPPAADAAQPPAAPAADAGPDTNYYRDDADVHYVPKRALQDLLL